ncbi:hypothetical protein KOR42_19260 [Thalassoglobus neptunius]|uniref:DUF2007 domain-containing protein n=1 Tax=Thalassoglobus neptunius TaxID=1938619 RepID=A0A5C5X8R9_9PLAN|nr:DUF2007 domain-containing protein [Thalassoglobus neptunius]TWT58545.1 hypothetical protein KOR42_19260 [Thalassoglobus neptunius]
MSEDSLIPIYTTTNLAKAEVIRAALEGEGIRCEIENEHQGGFTGVTAVRLFVLQKDSERAVQFIDVHSEGDETIDPA